jgi:hypothetical protein
MIRRYKSVQNAGLLPFQLLFTPGVLPSAPLGPALLFKNTHRDFVSSVYALPQTHLRAFNTAF